MASTEPAQETLDRTENPISITEHSEQSESVQQMATLESSSEQSEVPVPLQQDHKQSNSKTETPAQMSDEQPQSQSQDNPDGESCVKEVNSDVVEQLTYGLLAEFLPNLQKSQATLSEVTENQRILIETLQQENAKFDESDALVEVHNMMTKARHYQNKLLSIRKDMVVLHDKSAKLKKRALKLQQQKHKQILQQQQQHDRELDREQHLVAKLVTDKR